MYFLKSSHNDNIQSNEDSNERTQVPEWPVAMVTSSFIFESIYWPQIFFLNIF